MAHLRKRLDPGGIRFPRLYDLVLLIMTRGRNRAYRDALLDLAELASGDRVLDVGCGTGTQAIAACRRTQPGGSVVGIDVSQTCSPSPGARRGEPGVELDLRRADASALPFEDGSFDVVTMTTVMHMIQKSSRRLCIREALRVLRPGGRLIVADYAGRLDARRGWIAKHGPHGKFDLDDYRQMLADEGMTGIDAGTLGWLSLHFLRGIRR